MPLQYSSPPKVMHVVLSLGAGGGAERLVFDMVRDPAFADSPPVVCCLQEIGALGSQLQEEGFRVFCRPKGKGFDFSIVRWLAAIMRETCVEVVHAHQYTPMFYAVPAALLAGRKKVVYTEHGRLYPDLKSWKRRLINPLLSLGIDHIVSISEGTKLAMIQVDNFSSAKIKIIRNGVFFSRVDTFFDVSAKRRSLGLDDSSRIIGTAARLEEIKNIPMMLRGFKRVLTTFPNTYLLIAGRGTLDDVLKAFTRQLGIERRVIFLGLRDDLMEIYPLFDLFLLTSFSEGISVTLLEAMSNGIPVVATRVGGNPEVVVEGETGLMVGSDDDEDLAEKVLELFMSPEHAQNMGKKGMERVSSKFSFQMMMDNYKGLYEKQN